MRWNWFIRCHNHVIRSISDRKTGSISKCQTLVYIRDYPTWRTVLGALLPEVSSSVQVLKWRPTAHVPRHGNDTSGIRTRNPGSGVCYPENTSEMSVLIYCHQAVSTLNALQPTQLTLTYCMPQQLYPYKYTQDNLKYVHKTNNVFHKRPK